jgi:tetratricopeptide (TPR) repeat protein
VSLPDREVPEGLTAERYLTLGQEYIKIGWTEQARDALQLAVECVARNSESADSNAGGNVDVDIDIDINSETDGAESKKIAELATRLLRSKIPRFPVPLYAEQRNIEGWNLISSGETKQSKEIFEELIAEYPDFEWPYGNLSVLLLQAGEIDKAIELLEKALSVNPNYVQGWLHMATARGLQLNFAAARKCVKEALAIDPDEVAALAILDALERMRDL